MPAVRTIADAPQNVIRAVARRTLARACSLSYLVMLEESKKNDDRNWNS